MRYGSRDGTIANKRQNESRDVFDSKIWCQRSSYFDEGSLGRLRCLFDDVVRAWVLFVNAVGMNEDGEAIRRVGFILEI